MDNNAHTFNTFWSGQVPFIASFAVQQLRLWVSTNPWFTGQEYEKWFDLPRTTLESLQAEYQTQWGDLGQRLLTGQPFSFEDRRFSSGNWSTPLFGSLAAFYLLNAGFLLKLLDKLPIKDKKPRQRLLYLVEQAIAAGAPSNFLASNPDALQRVVDTQGGSLFTGLLHLASDLQEGKMRQCDSGAFKVGVDLANTPGEVVFENELFQLIQYYPQSETQYRRPVFIVPPSINKYYILDLRPDNSMVRHLLQQGHPVFLMSWRNFDQAHAGTTWDDLIDTGIIKGLQVTREISGEQRPNCVGFCIGGTLLSSALAVLAARGDKDIGSVSLLTTFLDYLDTGPIDIFVDEQLVAYRERTIGGQEGPIGLFKGEDMGNTFSLLRPNDLWWNYNVDKYLKGQKPIPLDLLFWNNDSTNLPGPMYCWYLRHTYLQNDLKSGELDCCGVKLNLRAIDAPAYILATHDDHIVPWRSAYASTQLLSGTKRFVLGASGHIAGVINPPAREKRHYWTNNRVSKDPDTWFMNAQEHAGSWWNDWFVWLADQAGERQPSVPHIGNANFPALESAPGRYVMQ
ncbi:MAG: class I poly(R)-hydroxyalkanoic acid synthase [Gammaproteobacteria bacterium]|nr:class I poly(R)-hydroxyalkanoic acid synthase [uncultured Pseudomonas sp.]MBU0525015.1 class I poly(R)-hydroxyalkanoic acid synthase [Gammaproteobacteria bacterium]MBU0822096.1 class I poly(R)-hydroxyalkanoic acid synthase [Gammaproteobacteria bacterium]MBU0845296.1 class I poly(R)-hydroxyalkanoic acid synthase [Gammaproteobacteria bacterium]MBU1842460.1 class I poly(R)-hydroxyalkanoic acid synthase [Gammaproteobacteria bacterium]